MILRDKHCYNKQMTTEPSPLKVTSRGFAARLGPEHSSAASLRSSGRILLAVGEEAAQPLQVAECDITPNADGDLILTFKAGNHVRSTTLWREDIAPQLEANHTYFTAMDAISQNPPTRHHSEAAERQHGQHYLSCAKALREKLAADGITMDAETATYLFSAIGVIAPQQDMKSPHPRVNHAAAAQGPTP